MSLSSVSEDFMQRQQGKKGKLRVFFGFAAGVGKTYAMLLEARELFALGKDVVIGYIEPHDRPETNQLLEGMPQIHPKKSITNQSLYLNLILIA